MGRVLIGVAILGFAFLVAVLMFLWHSKMEGHKETKKKLADYERAVDNIHAKLLEYNNVNPAYSSILLEEIAKLRVKELP